MAKLIYPPESGAFYNCDYVINGRKIKRLIISNHYKKKHSKYMSDALIIKLVENYLEEKRKEFESILLVDRWFIKIKNID